MKPCLHCEQPANNVSMTLCNDHIDQLTQLNRLEKKVKYAIKKLCNKYYIPDGDLGIDYSDSGSWRSYEISNACDNDKETFLRELSISEVGQDGEELNTYGFDDAPSNIQSVILKQAGIEQE